MPKHVLFDCDLPRNWLITTVDAIKADEKSACVAGPFGSNISSKYFVSEGVPVIRGGNLTDNLTKFVPQNFVFVSTERAASYRAQHARAGDLVFTCWGTIGQVGLIPARGPFPEYIISNKQLKLRPNTSITDALYLFYYFASPEMVAHVRSRAIGAAVPGINLGILKALQVVLPPLPVQRRIASILSAYDDLIENNTRRIAILEEMAQRLYEEWFVRFRFPGHEGVRMVESELGLVPEGWSWRPVGALLEHHIGGGWGKEEQSEDHSVAAYVIRGTDIPDVRGGSLGRAPLRFHTASNFRSRKLQARDIVFEVSGGSKDQPVGRAVMVGPKLLAAAGVPFICASFCRLVRADLKKVLPEILRFHFERIYENRQIMQYQTQSTGITNFKFTVFQEKEMVLVPSAEHQQLFAGAALPVLELAETLGLKNANLRTTRDLLLPKLISGELDVSTLLEPQAQTI